MDKDTAYQTPGSIKISQDVVASIARFAALEIDGVESVSSGAGMRGLLNKTSYIKPIRVQLDDDVVNVNVSIIAKYGVHIPEVASAVQQNVKSAIQSMTGLAVSRVDVTVAGTSQAPSGGERKE